MPESETIFSTRVTYDGLFIFKDLYRFCYDWLVTIGFSLEETEYSEKIAGTAKEIRIKWKGKRKVTDYFMYEVALEYFIRNMTDIEVQQGAAKVKMNKGAVEIKIKGNLTRDYEGKWEKDAFRKFLRELYNKYVIPGRINEYKIKLEEEVTEFTEQVKAFLTLEGKR